MAYSTGKIAVTADTATQIAGEGHADINTKGRTSALKLQFIPDTSPAVAEVGATAAVVNAGEGWVIFVTDETPWATEDLELVADDDLWIKSTEAGELRFWRA